MKRKVSLWVVLLLTWFFVGFTVIFGWAVWHIDNCGKRLVLVEKVIISIAKFPTLLKDVFATFYQSPFLLEDNYPKIKSIRLNNNINDDGYILLSSYDNKYKKSSVNLLRISDSKILHTWVIDIRDFKILNKTVSGFNRKTFCMVHPLLLEDGSIVFHNWMTLINIDLHSKFKWILKGQFHHSLELDAEGNIWVPSFLNPNILKPSILTLVGKDAIGKVSANGKLLFEKSVAEILLENGYRGLLIGVGSIINDQCHLNDIQPALNTTKFWEKGDLLISLRHLSTVFLYRPTTNKIIWLKTGPWLNQHDGDFIDSTKIGVFGNNLIRSNILYQPNFLIDGHNEEYIYDFNTNKISTPYTEFLSNSKVRTYSEGRSEILANGNLFVEETTLGRLLMGNKRNEIWSLVDRVDDKTISLLSWCRYISKKEFVEKYSKINFNTQ